VDFLELAVFHLRDVADVLAVDPDFDVLEVAAGEVDDFEAVEVVGGLGAGVFFADAGDGGLVGETLGGVGGELGAGPAQRGVGV
jgi:hypothetical protein